MRKLYLSIAIFIIAFMNYHEGSSQTVNPNYLDGKIYVRLKKNHEIPVRNGKINLSDVHFIQPLRTKYQITKMNAPFYTTTSEKLQRTYSIEFDNYEGVDNLIAELKLNPAVEKVEKCPYFKLLYTPNDYGSTAANNWHLTKIGAKNAWDISKGNPNVLIAILDNAIWTQHPDLQGKVVAQVDLADGDNDPTPPSQSLEWSHGTHTSGLAAAATDNGVGVSSIGFNCRLLAVKVGRDSDGALAAGFEGITWAADHGAKVISMSWGSPTYVDIMQDIVDYAYYKGCVLVAAAGNDGNETLTYPASCNHVISVGSTDGDDKKSSFSQYNSLVDLCAPGGYYPDGGLVNVLLNNSIYSLAYGTGNNAYTKMQGTSMSCPIVAGLAGLMISKDTNLTPDKVEKYLKATCVNIYNISGNSQYIGKLGAGRINAAAAMQMVQDSMRSIVANFTVSSNIITANSSVNFYDASLGTGITTWHWVFQGGTPSTSNAQNPQGITYSTPGVYNVTLTISDGTQYSTETKTAYIKVIQSTSSNSAWIEQATGFTNQYRGIDRISIVNNNIAWASAYNGISPTSPIQEFTRTVNGGNTWTPGVYSGQGITSTYQASSICALDENTAWVAFFNNTQNPNGNYGGIYKTTDGGQTWIRQSSAAFSDPNSFPNVVYFWDYNNGWCMGDPVGGYYEMYTTTDGGNTWTRVPQSNINAPAPESGEYGYVDLFEVKGDTVWFGTNKGHIYKSYDRGYHWIRISKTATGLTDVTKLTFNDAYNGVAHQHVYNQTTGTLTSHTMKKTNDGGLTWTTVTTTDTMFRGDISSIPGIPGKYVCTGSVGLGSLASLRGSAYTLDYGATWHNIDTGVQYTYVKFYDNYTGWAGGFNISPTIGGIYKWRNPNSITVPTGNFCPGTTINIGVIAGTTFNSGNVFTAQLSDANGSFANPVNIGSVNSNTTCVIPALIPLNTPPGSNYKVRVIASDPSLIIESTTTLTINPLTQANAGLDAEICYSSSYLLSGSASNYTNILWYTPNGTGQFSDSTIINPIYYPSSEDATIGTITIILFAEGQCGNVQDTMLLTLSSNPTAYAGNDVTICMGQSTQLFATGGNSYEWAPSTSLDNNNIYNPIASPTQTTTYIVTVTSDCGIATDDVTVFVNDLPQPTLSYPDTVFCYNSTITIQCNNIYTSYQWFKNNSVIPNANSHTLNVSETGNYSVQVIDLNGCSNTSEQIYIRELPELIVTTNQDQTICAGDTVTLNVTSSSPVQSYSWNPTTGLTVSGNTAIAYPSTTTTYTVIGTDERGCTGSDAVKITVNPRPAKPTITFNPSTLTLSVQAVSGATYQWYLNGNPIPNATSNTYQIPQGQVGTYTCVVIKNGCASPQSDPFIYTSVYEKISSSKFNIYPNPNNGEFFINYNTQTNEKITVEISNLAGQILFTNNYFLSLGNNTLKINCNNLAKGTYILTIITNDNKNISLLNIE